MKGDSCTLKVYKNLSRSLTVDTTILYCVAADAWEDWEKNVPKSKLQFP